MDELCRKLLIAKGKEAEAKEQRILIEKRIIKRIAGQKEEGNTCVDVEGYKIVLTNSIVRKLDFFVYKKAYVPEEHKFVKWMPEIDVAAFREAEREIPHIITGCVTSKPGKTKIKVYKK